MYFGEESQGVLEDKAMLLINCHWQNTMLRFL